MASPTHIITLPLRLGAKVTRAVVDTGLGAVRSVAGRARPEPAAPPREPKVGPPPPRVGPNERPPSRRRPQPAPSVAPAPPVEEPWEGYDSLRVNEIGARLRGAGAEVVAAVELYESAHRNRSSVQAAAARRLRELSGPGGSQRPRRTPAPDSP